MTVTAPTERPRDILASRWRTVAFFGLPSLAIVASSVAISGTLVTVGHAVSQVDSTWRGAVWAAAMGVMAAACLANALRCGRMHCYFTAPFFILTALASLAYGLGALPLGPSGWSIIGMTTVCGAVVLTWLPEAVLGKYRARGT